MSLMSRKMMRDKYGFDCVNNRSNWSSVNHDKRQVLFQKEACTTLIHKKDWESRSSKELLSHIELIDKKGYTPMLVGFLCSHDADGNRKVHGYFDRMLPAQLEWIGDELHASVKMKVL